jgi:hypothetical protein
LATQVLAGEELERLRGFPEIGREELLRFFTLAPLAHEFTEQRCAGLDGLLVVDPEIGMTRLRWLSTGPVEAFPAGNKAEVTMLEFLRGLSAPAARGPVAARVLRLGGVVALVLAVVAAITLRHVPALGDSKDRVNDAGTALTKETTG